MVVSRLRETEHSKPARSSIGLSPVAAARPSARAGQHHQPCRHRRRRADHAHPRRIEETRASFLAPTVASRLVAFRTRSVEAVRSLVATGAGIALLPDLVYRPWSLEGDRIEARPMSEQMPPVRVGVVWRRGSPLSEPATRFLDAICTPPARTKLSFHRLSR